MNRINTSHQTIAAKQRNCNYHPTFDLAPHVRATTTEIDSTEQVILKDGKYFVASAKFAGRYYQVAEQDGNWTCSARDASVASRCIEDAKEFKAATQEVAAKGETVNVNTAIESQTIKTVKIEYTDAPLIRCVARKDMPEAGILEGSCFYLVRSSKNDGTYYIVSWDFAAMRWACRCPATVKSCKHVRAVNADCKKAHTLFSYQPARKDTAKEQEAVETLQRVKVGNTTIVTTADNMENALSHHSWGQEIVQLGEKQRAFAELKQRYDYRLSSVA